MKCSTIIGTLSSAPTFLLEIEGEKMLSSTLSINGREYDIVGYETAYTESVGAKVRVTGHVLTMREGGKLKTYYKALQMEKADKKENDDSTLIVDGILVKRDPKPIIAKGRGLELITGIIKSKDAEDKYSLIHFVCEGKQARQISQTEIGSKVEVQGPFKKKNTVYELQVKGIF